jgi:hypothetical protein
MLPVTAIRSDRNFFYFHGGEMEEQGVGNDFYYFHTSELFGKDIPDRIGDVWESGARTICGKGVHIDLIGMRFRLIYQQNSSSVCLLEENIRNSFVITLFSDIHVPYRVQYFIFVLEGQ